MSELDDLVQKYWEMNQKEYEKVFSERYIEGEKKVLDQLNNAHATKSNDLLKLLKEYYPHLNGINNARIKPRIITIKPSELVRFQFIKKYNITPEIIQEIDSLFKEKTSQEEENRSLLIPDIKHQQYGDIQDYLENEHSEKIISGIDLTNYNIILNMTAKTFMQEHAITMFYNLGSTTIRETLKITNQTGEFERGTFLDERVLGAFAVLPDKIFFDFEAKRYARKNELFAIKLFLENYCRHKGISFHSEQRISIDEKNNFLERLKSAKYILEEKENIAKQMTPDHMKYVVACLVQRKEVRRKEENNDVLFTINYGGMIPAKDQLTTRTTKIRLKTIAALTHNKTIDDPFINELETIQTIIQQMPSYVKKIKYEEIQLGELEAIGIFENELKELTRLSYEEWETTHGGLDTYSGEIDHIYKQLEPMINKLFEENKKYFLSNIDKKDPLIEEHTNLKYKKLIQLRDTVLYQNRILPNQNKLPAIRIGRSRSKNENGTLSNQNKLL